MINWLLCELFGHCPGDITRVDEDTFTSHCIDCGAFMPNDDPYIASLPRDTPEQRQRWKQFEVEMATISAEIDRGIARMYKAMEA